MLRLTHRTVFTNRRVSDSSCVNSNVATHPAFGDALVYSTAASLPTATTKDASSTSSTPVTIILEVTPNYSTETTPTTTRNTTNNMPRFTSLLCVTVAFTAPTLFTHAASVPNGTWPTSQGTVELTAPQVVKAGTTFDGGMNTYERKGVTCTGQAEGGKSDAVFLVEPGATLKNVIIGKNQIEGVHCEEHDCTIENVWWDNVCEDALSIKNGKATSVSKIVGGGARNAEDKVIQHNGPGKITVAGFFAYNFGKLYRSCGNCKTQFKREVEMSNVLTVNPDKAVIMINPNLGDKATLTNVHVESSKSDKVVCVWGKGVTKGEPSVVGYGISSSCVYTAKDVFLNDKSYDFSSLGRRGLRA